MRQILMASGAGAKVAHGELGCSLDDGLRAVEIEGRRRKSFQKTGREEEGAGGGGGQNAEMEGRRQPSVILRTPTKISPSDFLQQKNRISVESNAVSTRRLCGFTAETCGERRCTLVNKPLIEKIKRQRCCTTWQPSQPPPPPNISPQAAPAAMPRKSRQDPQQSRRPKMKINFVEFSNQPRSPYFRGTLNASLLLPVIQSSAELRARLSAETAYWQ
jgi:hypothetical protein